MVEIKKDKHIYAAYCNMALHNFIQTFDYIAKCLDGVYRNSDDEITRTTQHVTQVNKKRKTDLKLKYGDLLKRHFPFLAPMLDKVETNNQYDLGHLQKLLENIWEVLNFYRNYTTHYDPDEDNKTAALHLNERNLVPCLKDLFKASTRTVQQRFGYSEREISFIKNMHMGKENFNYCLYKKEIISSTDSKPTAIFSLRGLVFFVSLFLEKKYISEMLAKTKAFYTKQDLGNTKRKSIIFESLAVYRIKLPRQRYDSEQDKIGLALDMVNELQRCPQELFDLLSTGDQTLFRSTEKSDDDPNTMLMVRHSDRFAPLAMRYIDQQKIFQSIRFQIALGKYRFAFYDKKCIDATGDMGETRVRSLQKDLHGFGRLDEIEKEQVKKWSSLIRDFEQIKPDTADSTPYITDHHASYLIKNNRVGLYWKAGKEGPVPGLPTLSNDPQSKDLRQRKKNGEQIVNLTSPKCFISTHELPALVFYHMLYETLTGEEKKQMPLLTTEEVIIAWVDNFKKFVQAVATGEVNSDNATQIAQELGIDNLKQVPKKILEYFTGANQECNDLLKQKLQERLKAHIDETQHLIDRLTRDLKMIEDKRNRRGTRKFVEIKPGRLGSWLAHDIIALQPTPTEGNNKLTGLNFQILQSALAVYDDYDALKRILVAAHLIMHDDAHPFLINVVDGKPQSTVAFYKKYLEARLGWLKSIASNDLRQYTFLTRGVNKWAERNNEFYQRVMQQYLSLPVELPRGLFEKPIKAILSHKLGNEFIKGDKRDDANVAFLIAKYFKQCYQDENQEFYTQTDGRYKRYYSFFKLLEPGVEYGKTVCEIDQILRNDTSLSLLNDANQEDENDTEVLERGIDEIKKKLAKALAKNPSLDKQQRIRDIINSSAKLHALSASQQNKLLRMASGENVSQQGLVQNYLKDKDNVEQERQFLSRALHKLKATERLIRRYKVQDIIIFLMARDILFTRDKEAFSNRFDVFKLKNIRPIRRQDGVSALEISVPFSITLHIKGSNVPVVIRQKSIKLKNYGDFHKFLNDSRIATLIPYLVDDENAVKLVIERSDLEREFEHYDHVRPDVFETVHKIERLILERHQELKDKSSPEYYYTVYNKNKNCEERKARINSFSQLLQYADTFSDEDRGDMINIRNSFSHNVYIGEGFEKVEVSTNEIGEIAPAISNVIEGGFEQIKKKD